ncbi:hypothetical protein PYCC9005_000927 [Savitreella phatthalungensis]
MVSKNQVAAIVAGTAVGTVAAQQCQCVTSQVVVAYTLAVVNGVTTTLGASVPTAVPANANVAPVAIGTSGSAACSFPLVANNQFPLGQIADGQIQAAAGRTTSTFTLVNGQVYDQAGRICEISGQNQAQFQCNYAPTTGATVTGFSISNGLLAFNGNTQFYACQLGQAGQGYNIYATLTGAQSNCQAVTLTAQGSNACVSQPANPGATGVASVVVPTAAAATTTRAAATTAAPTTGLPRASSGANSAKSSFGGIVAAVAAALFAGIAI